MKHAHQHTHPGENGEPDIAHGHFHEHGDIVSPMRASDDEHRKSPHEHEHTTRRVTVEITFDVGTLEDIGLGGFKVGWLGSKQDGREYDLTAGVGVGSSLLEASVRGPEGSPSVYAQADIRAMVSALWRQMEAIQGEMAAAKPAGKVCIGCESPQGEPHQPWCPVVTGTLRSLDEKPEA